MYKKKLFPALQREFGYTPTTWDNAIATIDQYDCAVFDQRKPKYTFSPEEL